MDQTIPQPVLYAVIGSLSLAICYLFKLIVSHHSRSMDEARAERTALIAANRDQSAAVDRNTKATAQLMMTMFFLPADFRKTSETFLREIETAEKERGKT